MGGRAASAAPIVASVSTALTVYGYALPSTVRVQTSLTAGVSASVTLTLAPPPVTDAVPAVSGVTWKPE